jgi:glycosyltransferase involved in cell wall biosynthesis
LSAARHGLITFAFGSSFADAAALVPLLALGGGTLAVALLLVYFHIAVGTRSHVLLFGGLTLQTVLIALFHDDAIQVATSSVVATGATAVALYLAARAAIRWPPGASDAVQAPTGPATCRLSVVLPCHNAGAGIGDVLTALRAELGTLDHEIIVVSDGSTDETVDIARRFDVSVIEYAERGGKGHALRVGLAKARGEYVAFMDSDGDISPIALRPFLTIMQLYEPDIVLGSKRHPLSEIEYPPVRRLLSWTYHKVTRVLFRVNVRDTQTGIKLLRRDVLAAVLPKMVEERYAVDLELLVVASRLGYKRVFEAPIRIEYRFDSQVDPHQALGILTDSFRIFLRRYVLNSYGIGRRRLRRAGEPLGLTVADRSIQVREREDRALRILIVNWRDIHNPEAGGAEVFTHEVASRWAASGHEVWILTSRFPGARQIELIDGVRIRRIGRLRWGTFHLRAQRELARLDGFDLVIDEINTVPFFAPFWTRGTTRTVALIHQLAEDVWNAELPRPLAAMGRRLERRMLSVYRHVPVVTVSESTRSDLLRLGITEVTVVPQGRDEPPHGVRAGKEHDPTFLFVGRLAQNKRPDHAVAAFRSIRVQLPGARLWVVGRGPMEASIRASLPDGADLLGHLSREELYERMARAHCLLVPSVREGWGMVITEANGVRTPAAGYDVAGIRDAIRPGVTGELADPADPDALARAAVSIVADAARYRAMCADAHAWASRFTWDKTAARLLHVVTAATVQRDVPSSDRSTQREEAPRELIPSFG